MSRPLVVVSLLITACTHGLDTQQNTTARDGGLDQATSSSTRTLGLDELCTAPVPDGYVNPSGQPLTAVVPTGRAVLALLQPTYAGTYTPQGPPAGYPWQGSLLPSAITITPTYNAGAVTCGTVACSCDPPGPCDVGRCAPPVVGVAIDQAVQTADGVFDEHVPSIASSAYGAGEVSIDGSLPATSLHGTYQISLGAPSQVTMYFEARSLPLTNGGSVLDGAVTEAAPTITGAGGSID